MPARSWKIGILTLVFFGKEIKPVDAFHFMGNDL